MLTRFFHRPLLILLSSVILLFLSVGMTRGDRGELLGPESWIKNGVSRLQGILYHETQAFIAYFAPENRTKPAAAPQELLNMKSQVFQLQQENEELKKLLGLKEKDRITYIPARVVYRSPDRWNNRVVIDRGSKDGVLAKMPIITSQGLIGRVQSVTEYMADIQLLTDSGAGPGIAAVIQGENEETLGIIEGYDPEKKRLIMKKIPASAKPKKGQIVVTSHLSDIYTGGILIGTVDQVKTGESGVDQIVYVKPSVTFERLDFVLVVRDPAKLRLIRHEERTKAVKGGEKR